MWCHINARPVDAASCVLLSGDGRQTSGRGISAGEASPEALDGTSQARPVQWRVRYESSEQLMKDGYWR